MIKSIKHFEIILFVSDKAASTKFYQNLFRKSPDLDVAGMTEFILAENLKLGLMPNKNIATILENKISFPENVNDIPSCELYLVVDEVEKAYSHALEIGAKLISPILARNWGDKVCYFSDPDGHIIAFAEPINKQNK